MKVRAENADRRQRQRGLGHGEVSRNELVSSIVGNYKEMPGLSLRLNQAARLFGVPQHVCQSILDHLVDAGQLRRAPDGQYTGISSST